MLRVCHWARNQLPTWIQRCVLEFPVPGTPTATLFNAFFPLSQVQGADRGRDLATAASLRQRQIDAPSSPFVQWITDKNPKPIQVPPPWQVQMPNLISQVMAAAALHFTWDLSLRTSLTNLIAHSTRVSKSALPLLNKVYSSSMTQRLLSTRVIILTPVIVQLIHMALICIDPEGKNHISKTLKTCTQKISQSLECVLHVRFALLSLGLSNTVYKSLVVPTCFWLLEYLTSQSNIQTFFKWYHSDKRVSDEDVALTSQLCTNVRLLFGFTPLARYDFWPTTGFVSGLSHMLAGLQASSEPYDVATLENLFNRTNTLKFFTSLQKFQTRITNIKSDIDQALAQGKISAVHATKLRPLVDDQAQKLLVTALQNYSFINQCNNADVQIIEQIVCKGLPEHVAGSFISLLQNLNNLPTLEDVFALLQNASSTPLLNTIFSDCSASMKDLLISTYKKALLHRLQDFYRDNRRSLLLSKHEITAFAIFCKNGWISHLAETAEDRARAHLLSAQFHTDRFESSLALYLANPPAEEQQKKEIEFCLLHLLQQTTLDLEQVKLLPDFISWVSQQSPLKNQSPTKNALDRIAQVYIKESSSFAFAREDIIIPNGFKFATLALPADIETRRNAIDPHTPTRYSCLPAPWNNPSEFQPPLRWGIQRAQEYQAMTAFIREKTRSNSYNPTAFLSTRVIKARMSRSPPGLPNFSTLQLAPFLQNLNSRLQQDDILSRVRAIGPLPKDSALISSGSKSSNSVLRRLQHFYQNNCHSSSIAGEEAAFAMLSRNGYIRQLGTDTQSRFDICLLSARFHVKRFEHSLRQYLARPPADAQKRKEIEFCLLHLARQVTFDSQDIRNIPGFAGRQQSPRDFFIQQIRTSPAFAFAREDITIPEGFKFETLYLAKIIQRTRLIIDPDKGPVYSYFQDCRDLDQEKTQRRREKQEMMAFVQGKTAKASYDPADFLSVQVITERLGEQ